MGQLTRGSTLLRDFLTKRKRTQCSLAEELTEKLGRKIHQGSVSAWMTGRYVPDTPVVIALHEVAKIPIASWLEAPRVGGGDGRRPAKTATGDR